MGCLRLRSNLLLGKVHDPILKVILQDQEEGAVTRHTRQRGPKRI